MPDDVKISVGAEEWWEAVEKAARQYAKRRGFKNPDDFVEWLRKQFESGRRGARGTRKDETKPGD